MSKCGAGAPARERSVRETSQNKVSEARAQITRPFSLLMSTLREIFEESAYERFLARAQVESSPAAYGNFLRETEAAKARRPKCC